MLKIQVLGTGLIPRGYGIAPRKDPFNADLPLIQTILSIPSFQVNFIRPTDGLALPLTRKNFMEIWKKYGLAEYKPNVPPVAQVSGRSIPPVRTDVPPASMQTPNIPAPEESINNNQEPKDNEVMEELKEDNGETKTEEDASLKPILAPEEKNTNNNHGNNGNNGNNSRNNNNNHNNHGNKR